jgi:hypothetical protein
MDEASCAMSLAAPMRQPVTTGMGLIPAYFMVPNALLKNKTVDYDILALMSDFGHRRLGMQASDAILAPVLVRSTRPGPLSSVTTA